MKEVIIDRSKWARGWAPGTTQRRLLNEHGSCCLGFVTQQLFGLSDDEIDGRPMPSYVGHLLPAPNILTQHTTQLLADDSRPFFDTALSRMAGSINDDANLTEHEREASLRALFADHGIKLTFVDP